MRRAEQPTAQRRASPLRHVAATLLVSIVAHFFLLMLLGTWLAQPKRRSSTEPIPLVLLELPPDPVTPEPEPEPAPEPRARRVRRATPAPAPTPVAPPALANPEASSGPAAEEPAVMALSDVGPRRLDLTPRLPEAPATARALDSETIPGEANRWAAARLDGYLRQVLGEDRVQSGAVEPGWSHIARRAERSWEPEFAHVQEPELTEISGAWLARLARDWFQGWREGAAKYGASGKSMPDEDDLRHDMPGMAALELNRAAYGGEGYGHLITAVIEVNLEASGEGSARLFRSSGYSTFDDQVVLALEQALDAPDRSEFPEGPARALYAMSAHYIILPPLPVVGFSFDVGLGHFDPMYPLKKIVRGNARLISVERPGKGDQG